MLLHRATSYCYPCALHNALGEQVGTPTGLLEPAHFGLKKTLNADNWHALRRLGEDTNARFITALGEGRGPCPTPPPWKASCSRAPTTASVPHGFASATHGPWPCSRRCPRSSSARPQQQVPPPPHGRAVRPPLRARQATYDLRQLRLKGLVERAPGTHTYRVTTSGRAIATFSPTSLPAPSCPCLPNWPDRPSPRRSAPSALRRRLARNDRHLPELVANLARAA